jgi:hypothetical protein
MCVLYFAHMLGALLHIAPVHCTIYCGLLAPSNITHIILVSIISIHDVLFCYSEFTP